MKAKRSIYNLIVGIVSQFIILGLGLIIPRLFLTNYGSEVNGLMSSINQIFVYITILEAGVGNASIQALYSPITRNDKDDINSILAATSHYYKKTGIWYLFCILGLSIIYPIVVKSSVNKITIMLLILFTGMGGVLNYFFQGKYKLLLVAEGKNYINTSINTFTSTLSSLIKIFLLYLGVNVVFIQISYFLINIFQMSIIYIYIRKNYTWIDLSVLPNHDSISQKNSVLIHQISGIVFNNTDILLLSIFGDFKMVSVYTMYSMIFNIVDSIISICNNSVVSALGQTYQECKTKFINIYEYYESIFFIVVFSLYTVVYILILPFMKIYTEDINDINYIHIWLPMLFVIMKLLHWLRTPGLYVLNFEGAFKKTEKRAIYETIINIVLSLIFVQYFGIYGVLMGTIVALIFSSTYTIIYSNTIVLKRSLAITYIRWGANILTLVFIISIFNKLNIPILSYIHILKWSIIISIISFILYFILSILLNFRMLKSAVKRRKNEDSNSRNWICRTIKCYTTSTKQ